MKNIFLILICFFGLNAYAQFPAKQTIGTPTTLVTSRGGQGADSGFVYPTFLDTARMNGGFLKNIAGIMVRQGDTLWLRNKTATQWLPIIAGGTGGGNKVDSVTFSTDSLWYHINGDSTFITDFVDFLTDGDTTIFDPAIDSTGQSGYRVIFAINNKLYGSDKFWYDSSRSILRINSTKGLGSAYDLAVGGQSYFNNDVEMADVPIVGDTATFKPMAIGSNGFVKQFLYWPSGGGGTDSSIYATRYFVGQAYVPYTGAIENVYLGAKGLYTDHVTFATTPTAADSIQRLTWDSGEGTLNLGLEGGNVNLSIGAENVVKVFNESGSPLTDGQLVYIVGSQGNRVSVKLASDTMTDDAAKTLGMVTEAIGIGATGFVTIQGVVNHLATDTIPEGTQLWLGAVPGTYTDVMPSAPNQRTSIGVVTRSHATVGSIFVRVVHNSRLEELDNVGIDTTTVTDGQVLAWDDANGYWKNRTPTDLIGASVILNQQAKQNGKRFDIQSGKFDSLYASTATGLILANNVGSRIATFGSGGGTTAVFEDFTGYNSNIAATYTTRSFTDKNYVDSSVGLRLLITDTTGITGRGVATFVKNATLDSAILTLIDGTRLAVRDSIGGGGGGSTEYVVSGLGIKIDSSGRVYTVNSDTASAVVLSRQRAANTYALIGAAAPGGSIYNIQYNRNGAFAGNTTFVYDSINARVGIGTASPSVQVHINNSSLPRLLLQSTASGGEFFSIFSGTVGSVFGFSNTGWFKLGRISGVTPTDADNDFFINSTGQINIGSNSPNAASKLHIVSTSSGLSIPQMTTTQRNAVSWNTTATNFWVNSTFSNSLEFCSPLATALILSQNQYLANETITGNKTLTTASKNTTHLHYIDATSGNITVTLPASTLFQGSELQFIRIDGSANTVTIQRAGTNTINNALTSFTMAQYERASVIGVSTGDTFSWHAGKLTNY